MKQYSKEFKEEALKLSDEIGVKNAAQQLGIAYYTLADWRGIQRNKPPVKALSAEEQLIRIRELERAVVELRTASRRQRQKHRSRKTSLSGTSARSGRLRNFSRTLPRCSARTASCMFLQSWTASAERSLHLRRGIT